MGLTQEQKLKISNSLKAARAAETEEQKEKRRKARSLSWAEKNIEEKIKIRSKISASRKKRSAELQKIAKDSWNNRATDSKLRSINAMLESCHKETVQVKASVSRRKKQKVTNIKISNSIQAYWNNIGVEEKNTRIKSSLSFSSKEYKLINGSFEKFQSSWEAACANVLIKLGICFKPQFSYLLGNKYYIADFYLPLHNIIIEVKGCPKAWERWWKIQVPIIREFLDSNIKVFVLGYKPNYKNINSFDNFISSLDQLKLGELLEHP